MTKVRPKVKYDFVGHISYPDNESIRKIFFVENPTVPIDIVTRNGKVILRGKIEAELASLMTEIDYTVTRVHEVNPNLNRSIRNLPIKCTNEACLYHSEIYHGNCNIKLKAQIEVINDEKNIVVKFKARDMRETTYKSDCILTHVLDLTGVEGDVDSFSKMEMC